MARATSLPSGFDCPGCGTNLDNHSPVTPAAKHGVKKGMIIVCGHCATFCVVGDSTLERLTVQQFKAQPVEVQRLLGIMRMNIERKNGIKRSR